MAARKKKAGKAKKKASPAKKSKSVARKAAKRPAKKAKKPAKKAAPKAVKKSVKAVVKKAPAARKKNMGEGDYAASRAFDKDQAGFVAKNKAKIPAMGKEAEAALDGPEGTSLRDAEAIAAGRSRDIF